jgi:hypothetical protein
MQKFGKRGKIIIQINHKEHNETLTNKYTFELPTGTPAAEEYATKAKRHPNRTFTPFQSSQRSYKKKKRDCYKKSY